MSSANFTLTISTPEGLNSRSKGTMTPEQYEAITRILGAGDMPTSWASEAVKDSLTTEQPSLPASHCVTCAGTGSGESLEDCVDCEGSGVVPARANETVALDGVVTTEQPEDGPECEEHEPISTPHCAICLMQERDALRAENAELRERVKELGDMLLNLAGAVLDDDTSPEVWKMLARQANALFGDDAAMQEGKS